MCSGGNSHAHRELQNVWEGLRWKWERDTGETEQNFELQNRPWTLARKITESFVEGSPSTVGGKTSGSSVGKEEVYSIRQWFSKSVLNYFPQTPFPHHQISYMVAQIYTWNWEWELTSPPIWIPSLFTWPGRHFYRNPRALLNIV